MVSETEPEDGFAPLPRRPACTGRGTPGDAGVDAHESSTSTRRTTQVATRKQALRLPPRPPAAASPLLGAISPELTETFHYMLARLQLDGSEPLPSRVGIVAATHGEGVTTVARAMAAILANDYDTTVCLVDLNPPTSSGPTERASHDGGPPGLFDVLSGTASLDEALIDTADPRLRVLNAGACDSTQARNLARATGLDVVFDELESICEYIIFDVPPILVGSEGLSLLRYTTGYLMVVRHGMTPIDQIRAAAEEIGSIPAVGVILNRVSTKIPKRFQRFFRP